MTNREIEDVEEYVGRPIMGFLRRAFDAATKERVKEGNDPRTGEPFTETEEYLDQNELVDHLPTKIMNALNCIQRRRNDPEFTMDKWAEAVFGDDGTEQEAENKEENPTASSSDMAVISNEALESSPESSGNGL